MITVLSDRSVVVHLFAPLAGPDREPARAQLDRVWLACWQLLGMTDAIPSVGLRAEPPDDPADPPALGAIAARRRAGPGLRQALWVQDHNVACVSIALGAITPEADWSDPYEDWTAATADIRLDALLGRVEIFTALSSRDSLDRSAGGGPEAAVAAALPTLCRTGPITTPLLTGAATTCYGQVAWRIRTQDTDPIRRLAVVAPAGGDPQLSALVWTRGEPELAPLTRYLMHDAVVDYQMRVAQRHRSGRLRDGYTAELRLLGRRLAGGTELSDTDLADAEDQIARLQAGQAGLIDTTLSLTAMRRTVQISASNMRAIAERIVEPDPGTATFVDHDLMVADSLDQWLDDESLYLSAARDRSEHLAAIAARDVQRRVQTRREAQRRRSDRFGLVQAAIIGAAVLILTAVQSLQYRVPMPGPVTPAVIAALGALAFYLSTAAVRLAHPQPPTPLWPRALESAALGLLSAAMIWTVTAWGCHVVTHRAAPATVTTTLAVLVAAGTAATAWRRSYRR